MSDVKYMNPVSLMPYVKLMPSVWGLQGVTPLSFMPQSKPQPLRVKNFAPSTPKSLLDLTLGFDQRDNLLDKYGVPTGTIFSYLPTTHLALYFYDRYIEPVVENGLTSGQGWKEVGLNTLQAVGQDLDIFSNLVKSQTYAAGGEPGLESLANALGLNGTRKVYNFNTGSTLKDMVLEFISDPITWFTLGAAGAAKSGISSATKEVAGTVAEQSTKQLSKKALKEFSKKLTKATIKYGDDVTYDIVVKTLSKQTAKEIAGAGLDVLAPKLIKQVAQSNGYRLFKNASLFKAKVKAFDSAYTKVVWRATPVLPVALLKDKLKPVFNAISNQIKASLKDYNLSRNFVKVQSKIKSTLNTAIYQNNAIHETVFRNNKAFFSKLKTDETTLQQYFYKFIQDGNAKYLDSDKVYAHFFEYLQQKAPKMFKGISKKAIKKMIADNAIRELIDTISIAPLAIYNQLHETTVQYNAAKIRSMKRYFARHKNNVEDIYRYLDQHVLRIGKQYYGLENFENYLKALFQNDIDVRYRQNIVQLFETLGVNVDNAINIKKILTSSIDDKSLAIRKLLKTSDASAQLLTKSDYVKLMKKTKKYIDTVKNKEINKIWKEAIFENENIGFEEVKPIKNMREAIKKLELDTPFKIGDNTFKNLKIVYNPNLSEYALFHDGVIELNISKIEEGFKNKVWKNRALTSLKNYEFKSVDEFAAFIAMHEYAHSIRRPIDVVGLDKVIRDTKEYYIYESQIDKDALKLLKSQRHNILYIYENIRMQDLPSIKKYTETMSLVTPSEKLKPHLDIIEKHIKDTIQIMEDIQNAKAVTNIPTWYYSLKDVNDSLNKISEELAKDTSANAVQPRKLIAELKQTVQLFRSERLKDPIANYITNLNGVVQTQLTHAGMFNTLLEFTHLSEIPEINTVVEELANPTSITRRQVLPEIINTLRDAGQYSVAQNMIKVTAQIDTVVNLQKLLTAELPTSFKLSDNLQQQIKLIIFDIIDNNKDLTLVDLLSNANKVLDDTGDVSDYQRLLTQMKDRLENTDNIIKQIAKETAQYNRLDVIKEIEEQMHFLFDEYINNQSLIKGVDNLTLATMYGQETIDMLALTANTRFNIARNATVTKQILNEYDVLARQLQQLAGGISSGLKEIETINNKFKKLAYGYEINNTLKEYCEQYNLMSASIESGMYGTKYLTPKADFILNNHLERELFSGTNNEYLMLVNRIKAYSEIVHEPYKYTPEYAERLKEVLIKTYSEPNALFAPIDPFTYFNSFDVDNTAAIDTLLAWEVVSKSNLSMRNKTSFYDYLLETTQLRNYNEYSKSDLVSDLEAVLRDNVNPSDEKLGELIVIANRTNALQEANQIIDNYLLKGLHDLDDLGKYHTQIVSYLEKNVRDLNYIVYTIQNIENNPALRSDIGKYKSWDVLKDIADVDFGYADAKINNLREMYIDRKISLALAIANMTPEQLATHLYKQTPGGLVFYNNNIVRTLNPDNSVTWSGIQNIFDFTQEELNDAGLKITRDGDWYYIRLIDNRPHNAILNYGALLTEYPEQQKEFTDLLDKYRAFLNLYTDEDVPMSLVTAETLNQETWYAFLKAHEDFFGDFEEQKLYQKISKQGYDNFFNKSFSRVNLTVVGGYDAYNIWNKMYSNTFIPHSMQLSNNTLNGLTSFIVRANKLNKYLTLFFNNDYSLDNPLFKTMFSKASDERIAEFFASGEYRAVILRADKQNLPKIFEYKIYNRASLEKAIKAEAILVPVETYTSMKQVINSRVPTNDILDLYKRVVPTTYKSMYLFTVGFGFRNAFDTLIFKNGLELGDFENLLEVFKYEREAIKAVRFHDKIQKEAMDLAFEATGIRTFNREAILEVLSKHSKDEAELYFLLDVFMQSNASGGLNASLRSFIEEYNKVNTEDIRMLWEKLWENKILFGEQKLNPFHYLHKLNDHIETTGRLALFLGLVDEGLPIKDAINKVIKTHFNYKDPSDLLDICEKIFWFSTFPINNLNYYLGDGLYKAPMLVKLLMDANTASWNNGTYTYEELKKTNFASYHALAGNIRIGNIVIKLSPSLFDFIGLVTDLPGNIKDRLNPFFAVLTDQDANISEELNPFITQVRNWQKFKEGNPIPSVLSFINENDKYNRAMYKWRSNRTSSGWTRYPKVRKAVVYSSYARKYYARRYRTDVRKLTRTSLWHDKHRYYRISKRGPTYYDL